MRQSGYTSGLTTLRRAIIPPKHAVLLILMGAIWALIYRSAGTAYTVYDSREGNEALALAESLSSRGAYADAYSGVGSSGPSAALPPVIPFALFVGEKLTGSHFPMLVFVCCFAAFGLHSLLLVRVSANLFTNTRPGWIASICTAILPVYRVFVWSDAIYIADAIMLSIIATSWLLRRFGSGLTSSLLIGLLTGILFLTDTVAVSIFLSFLVWFLLREKRAIRIRRSALLISLGAFCVISPWTVRNALVLRALVPLRDDSGILLSTAYNECAAAGVAETRGNGCLQLHHPGFSSKENHALFEAGEVEYNESKVSAAASWVLSHRTRAISLTLQRIADFWFPPLQPAAWLAVLLGWGGIGLLTFERHNVALPLWSALAVYPFWFYFLLAQQQNVYPVLWILCLAGGYLIAEQTDRFRAVGLSEYRDNE